LILLSFDLEEFDMPNEYGKEIPFDDQIAISVEGTYHVLKILAKHEIKATFFSTVVFAQNNPSLIGKILEAGHELASHGFYHSKFETAHLLSSKVALEELSGQEIKGFRMARMMSVDENEITKAGYLYNSSINPTWLPGRYNNFSKPRTFYHSAGTWQLPASVSPVLRFPLFWLSFHNLPLTTYQWIAKRTYLRDGYLNLYFHPWEFTDLGDKERFGFPAYISRNSGNKMIERMDSFLTYLKRNDYEFSTIWDFKLSIQKS